MPSFTSRRKKRDGADVDGLPESNLPGETRSEATSPEAPPVVVQAPAQAAWYADPADPDCIRYWDGAQWTERMSYKSRPAPPVEAMAPSDSAPAVPDSDGASTNPVPDGTAVGTPPPPHVAERVQAPPPETTNGQSVVDEARYEQGAISVKDPAAPVHRGPHYILGFGIDHDGISGPGLAEVGATLVTGEVPLGYDRVIFECEGGRVEATFLDPENVNANLFVALVDRRVQRVVATKSGGIYGIFFDVALLEKHRDA